MSRQRILLISRNLPPLLGGMERVSEHVYRSLRAVAEVSVAGPHGCREFLDPDSPCLEFAANPPSAYLAGSLVQAWRLAKKTRPSLVLCGSGTAALAGVAVVVAPEPSPAGQLQ